MNPEVISNFAKKMSSQDLLTLVLYTFLASVFFFFLMKKHRNWKQSKPKRLPPGPPRLPVIGNLHQLKHPLHRTLHDLSRVYGDLMFLQLGTVPTLVISSAEMAREVITNHDTTFGARASRYFTDTLAYGGKSVVFSNYGEYWREARKIVVLEMLSPKRVQSFAAIREDEVVLMLGSIAQASPGRLDLTKLLHQVANNVLCRVAFGRTFHGESSEGKKSPLELLEEIHVLSGNIYIADFFPRLGWLNKLTGLEATVKKIFQGFDEIYDSVIQQHLDPNRPKSDHEDLIDVLLRVQRDRTDSSSSDNNFVKALIADMLIAGTETTAGTLVWIMTELLRNPSAMKRAQEEVRTKVKGKERVEESDLQDLVYIKAVVKESLRLHATVPLLIPRVSLVECEINGYHIPAKTMLFINTLSMGMDTRSWDEPTQFRPERFLGSAVDFRGQHYELMPFGVGRRACAGINFAMAVIELVIANILYRFDWELPEGMRPEDVHVEEAVGLVVNRTTPLQAVARPVES